MFDVTTRKLTLRCFTLIMLLLCLFFFMKDSTKSLLVSAQTGQGQAPSPNISIASQDGAPLRIMSTSIESTAPQDFRLRMIIQSQSVKGIRAYTIVSETATDKVQNERADFLNLRQKANTWQPTVIKAVEFRDTKDEPLLRVKLMIDFVEFSDGTTWGPDTHKSSEILAGQRAGARQEAQRLRQLLKGEGRAAVIADIQSAVASDLKALAGPNRSSEWLEGFRSGTNAVRGRLKQAWQSASEVSWESELDKPFDTSEEKLR